MPKKKGKKLGIGADFTINDCANAPKPVARVKKSVVIESLTHDSWEELDEDDLEVIQKSNPEESKVFIYKKRRNHSKCEIDINDRPGIVYPEIVWYLISPYIKPEEVGNFAGINQSTYSITKRESFWRAFYKRYCQNKRTLLPKEFRIDNDYKLYGLRVRVIRALYFTYDVFMEQARREASLICHGNYTRHYELVGRTCVNIWYGNHYATIYFKLKKLNPARSECKDFIEELGRIDANPEEDTQVLQVVCMSYQLVPSSLGMVLASVREETAETCNHRVLHLGFNRRHRASARAVECTISIGGIAAVLVSDWWLPQYPLFEIKLPSYMREDESVPVLDRSFFSL